jgi:hypothetical protein
MTTFWPSSTREGAAAMSLRKELDEINQAITETKAVHSAALDH